jgi:hypothetical protein
MPGHRFAAADLDDALRRERAQGGGWQRALPWLTHPNHHQLAERPEMLDYLRRVNPAIDARVGEL